MHRRLVLALLLALLLEPATASSPNMDVTLPVTPLESFYSSSGGILPSICDLCGISLDFCAHALDNLLQDNLPPPRRTSTFTVDTFLSHPEWAHLPTDDTVPDLELSPEPDTAEPEQDLRLTPYANTDTIPLCETTVEQLNINATTVQHSTVQIHVNDTYTPGDRLRAQSEPRRKSQKRQPHKRQPPRPGGFQCKTQGCGKAFDRACELNRHKKVHLDRYERPHKCDICNEGFLYPKDCIRHQRTHDQPSSPQTIFHCRVPGCPNLDGFSRRDNLLRHQRKQHPHMI